MPNRTIGLAGNPNCGKTTLFNRLTGARQVTGNWPGVTVERKEGQVKGKPWTLVDLPGTYSLISYSPEEKVAASFLRDTPPDLVLNIVDATALERNLFLTLQLLEQNLPTVVAVNLCDQLAKNGGRVDCKVLSQRLGVPVIPISARSGENIGKLVKALEKADPHPVIKITDKQARYFASEAIARDCDMVMQVLRNENILPVSVFRTFYTNQIAIDWLAPQLKKPEVLANKNVQKMLRSFGFSF